MKLSGSLGWFFLMMYVLFWDLTQETLSDAFWRWLEGENTRLIAVVVWFSLTVHLFKLVPEKYDLFWWAGKGLLWVARRFL